MMGAAIAYNPCHKCTNKIMCEMCELKLYRDGVTVQKWIPAEKPPEKEGSYLVFSKTGKVYTAHYYTEKKCSEWYTRKAKWSHPNVTHWMPLPEPPKEET